MNLLAQRLRLSHAARIFAVALRSAAASAVFAAAAFAVNAPGAVSAGDDLSPAKPSQQNSRTSAASRRKTISAGKSLAAEQPTPQGEQAEQDLAAELDTLLAAHWREAHIAAAPVIDDATFVRRVWLDITGRIPPATAARAFVADPRPDKRTRLIRQLVESPGFVTHMASSLRKTFIPEAAGDAQLRGLIPAFTLWLQRRLRERVSYDALVRELLTVPLQAGAVDPSSALQATPTAFFFAKRLDPATLAAGTSRAFLGVRIDCAQCHDHPFDSWKREDFWSVAAFFSGIESAAADGMPTAVQNEVPTRRTIMIPDTDKTVTARFLGEAASAHIDPGQSVRAALADWVTSERNPYFARTLANRLWSHFWGIGFVHPADDFGSNNPAVAADVLDRLAQAARESQFDLRFLVRVIASTQAYQRSSGAVAGSAEDAHLATRLFARQSVKPFTGEQLYDSLALATGAYDAVTTLQDFARLNSPRERFVQMFGSDSASPEDRRTTILQALALMNGEQIAAATNLENSRSLRAVTELPTLGANDRIEALFWLTLSRPPRDSELEAFAEYLAAGPADDQPRRLANIFWALLNCAEFVTNH